LTEGTSDLLPSKQALQETLKESPLQISRMIKCLTLSRLLPDPMPAEPKDFETNEPDGERSLRSDGAQEYEYQTLNNDKLSVVKTDDFSWSEELRPLRIKIKKQIHRNHMDVYSTMPSTEVRYDLEREWQKMYCSFYRTIKKLRQLFPVQSAACSS